MEIVDKLKERIAKTELRKKDTYAHYFFDLENQQAIMEGLVKLLEGQHQQLFGPEDEVQRGIRQMKERRACICGAGCFAGHHAVNCPQYEAERQAEACEACPRCGSKFKGLHSIECAIAEIRERQKAKGTCSEFVGEQACVTSKD